MGRYRILAKNTIKMSYRHLKIRRDLYWSKSVNEELIEEIIAEIKRDIDMSNLMALREALAALLKDTNNTYILKHYLSEFPELREEYREQPEEDQDWANMNDSMKQNKTTDITKLKNVWEEKSKKERKDV